jgi:hypothetical protein
VQLEIPRWKHSMPSRGAFGNAPCRTDGVGRVLGRKPCDSINTITEPQYHHLHNVASRVLADLADSNVGESAGEQMSTDELSLLRRDGLPSLYNSATSRGIDSIFCKSVEALNF